MRGGRSVSTTSSLRYNAALPEGRDDCGGPALIAVVYESPAGLVLAASEGQARVRSPGGQVGEVECCPVVPGSGARCSGCGGGTACCRIADSARAIARPHSAKPSSDRGTNTCTVAVSGRELVLTRRGVVVAVPWALPQQTGSLGWWAKVQEGIGHPPRAASRRLKADPQRVNAIQQEDCLSTFQTNPDAQGNTEKRACSPYNAVNHSSCLLFMQPDLQQISFASTQHAHLKLAASPQPSNSMPLCCPAVATSSNDRSVAAALKQGRQQQPGCQYALHDLNIPHSS